MFCRLSSVLTLIVFAAVGSAQPPMPADVFQANPEYLLTARQGPFMIYVASFRGDNAGPLAQDLVKELRDTYKLSAFLLRRMDEEAAAQRDLMRQEQIQRYGENYKNGKKVRVLEDWAVLVGNYRDMDAARADLNRVKSVEKPKGLGIYSTLQEWSHPVTAEAKRDKSMKIERLQVQRAETFRQAFVTHNPLAPKQALAKDDAARTLQTLNESERYSLLHNKSPFTLVVMEFRAPMEVTDDKPSVFDQKGFAGFASPYAPDKNHMEHGYMLAQRLRDQLSDNGKGYDAYLMHTKAATYVTVGGFKGPEDPELHKAQRALSGLNIGGIQLLRTPYPCQVPKT